MSPTNKAKDWIDTENTPERRILDLREIGMTHALTLGRLKYQRASKPLETQHHDRWLVLVFLFSGVQRYLIDGQERLLHGGDVLRILPGQHYGTGPWPEQRSDLAWLILRPPSSKKESALGMTPTGATEVFKHLTHPTSPAVRPMPNEILGLVTSIFDCWPDHAHWLVREQIRNRIAAMILAVATSSQPSLPNNEHANIDRIHRVLDWLNSNHQEIPNTKIMAQHAGLSAASFHRYFKQVTGCTPRDYELRRQINHAAAILRDHPNTSITRLAHDLGFASSQYFATVFKRYMGHSPTDFRSPSQHE